MKRRCGLPTRLIACRNGELAIAQCSATTADINAKGYFGAPASIGRHTTVMATSCGGCSDRGSGSHMVVT